MVALSWSKLIFCAWCVTLAFVSSQFTQFVQGLVALVIGYLALSSNHGDALLIMPLVFLSERCLDEIHAHGHSPMLFYAAGMLAYMQRSLPHGTRATTSAVLNQMVPALAGSGSFLYLTRDITLCGGFAAYTIGGLLLFVALRQHLDLREAVILSSLGGWLLFEAICNNSINTATEGRLTATTIPNLAARAALLSALLICIVMYYLPLRIRSRGTRTVVFHAVAAAIIGSQYALFNYLTGRDALTWLFDFCFTADTARRPYIIMAWASGIPVVTVAISVFGGQMALLDKRKLFHFLSVAAFAPVIITDPDFFHVAISVAVAITLIVEAARVYDTVGAKAITTFLSAHIDHRDHKVIRTHTYLMLAMGVALILRGRRIMLMSRALPLYAELALYLLPGVFALGIADAFAAIVGRRFGQLKWASLLCGGLFPVSHNNAMTHKSPAGTFGAIVSCCLAWAAVMLVVGVSPLENWAPYAAIVGIAVMETVVEGVDNLELPLIALGLTQTLVVIEKFVERTASAVE